MGSQGGSRGARRSWLVIVAVFGVLGLMLGLVDCAGLREIQASQQEVDGLVGNAVLSLQLVNRMGADLYRRQLLVDEHIAEPRAAEMRAIEQRIAAIEADRAAAAREYEPLAMFPGERPAWRRLERDTSVLAGAIAQALSFSRENRDDEARAALRDVQVHFEAIDREIAELARINREAVRDARAQIVALQRSAVRRFAGLAALAALLSGVVVLRLARTMRSRDHAVALHADLLEARNRDLDAFAGRVAHDLRSPLATISMAAGVLSAQPSAPAKALAILARSVRAMEQMIGDLLALSRLEVEALPGICDPAAVVAEVCEDLGQRHVTDGAALHVHLEPARVRCSGGLLRQVVTNLVDNAVKYRRLDATPVIMIEGCQAGERYELRIADNGVGMSAEELRRAFDPFFRAATVRDRPGTGLGLSIVKRVIEACGGAVTAESKLGLGTTFHLALDLAGRDEGQPISTVPR